MEKGKGLIKFPSHATLSPSPSLAKNTFAGGLSITRLSIYPSSSGSYIQVYLKSF
jgi:hypothetical protein